MKAAIYVSDRPRLSFFALNPPLLSEFEVRQDDIARARNTAAALRAFRPYGWPSHVHETARSIEWDAHIRLQRWFYDHRSVVLC